MVLVYGLQSAACLSRLNRRHVVDSEQKRRENEGDMLDAKTHREDWLQLIRGEYLEIPNLCLTKPQVERLWDLDNATSEDLLEALVDVRFLRRTTQDAYVRADLG